MAAAIALTIFTTLAVCGLRQLFRLGLQRPLSVSSTLPRTNSLICPLISSSLNCTIFSDMVCNLLSEWCVVTSYYQRSANLVSFILLPFVQLIVPYPAQPCRREIGSKSHAETGAKPPTVLEVKRQAAVFYCFIAGRKLSSRSVSMAFTALSVGGFMQ